jgi:hypothetical protein
VTAIAATLAGTVILAIIIKAINLLRQPSAVTPAQADAIEAGLR